MGPGRWKASEVYFGAEVDFQEFSLPEDAESWCRDRWKDYGGDDG